MHPHDIQSLPRLRMSKMQCSRFILLDSSSVDEMRPFSNPLSLFLFALSWALLGKEWNAVEAFFKPERLYIVLAHKVRKISIEILNANPVIDES